MQPSLEKLRKFFRLEHENGYNNIAIIGGLAKMLDYWEGDARADGIQEEVIQAVVQRLRSYDGLTPQSRADALKGLWKRIGETYPEAQQKPRNGTQVRHPAPLENVKAPDQVIEQRPRPEARPRESDSGEVQRQDRLQRPAPPPRSETIPGARTSATPAAL
ncbi:MAG TPA: hypothetical protein VFG81_00675, partial [Anaerolineales bacterium]|nr:hypothetical protein [Anaerolineales bacterium]